MIQPQLFKDINSSNLFRPPLRYPGSKFGAIKIIKNFLPKESINDYCEPFFGSGAFFFKLIEAKRNLLNDFDNELVNFYKVIQNKDLRKKLIFIVSKFKPFKTNFYKLKKKVYKDSFKQACRYFIINRTAYSGIMHNANWGYHSKKSVPPEKWGERIENAGSKLNSAKISSLDFREFFKMKNFSNSTFFFVDPPYYEADQKRAYKKSFAPEDHIDLQIILKRMKNKFLLTYDNCSKIRKIYDWANVNQVSWRYHTANSNKTTRKMGNELIITNY